MDSLRTRPPTADKNESPVSPMKEDGLVIFQRVLGMMRRQVLGGWGIFQQAHILLQNPNAPIPANLQNKESPGI